MAEFQKVMVLFARLCDYYSPSGCHGCPVDEAGFNCACERQGCSKSSAEEVEAIIMAWAAEHPEPVYPRWIDWLADVGLIINTADHYAFNFAAAVDQIPADIAEKLGIVPKEG